MWGARGDTCSQREPPRGECALVLAGRHRSPWTGPSHPLHRPSAADISSSPRPHPGSCKATCCVGAIGAEPERLNKQVSQKSPELAQKRSPLSERVRMAELPRRSRKGVWAGPDATCPGVGRLRRCPSRRGPAPALPVLVWAGSDAACPGFWSRLSAASVRSVGVGDLSARGALPQRIQGPLMPLRNRTNWGQRRTSLKPGPASRGHQRTPIVNLSASTRSLRPFAPMDSESDQVADLPQALQWLFGSGQNPNQHSHGPV
ncbi:unnamed protein product [Rangifer tarandus platyrhynchus]|uniref:Uncharacterized protein n=1 Tax=Rangifer tarandus platyrhynchus TaxID=3082113 RepID=A0AC59ZNJ4_RANTA